MKITQFNYSFFILLFFHFFIVSKTEAINLEKGEKIFITNCSVCHFNGNNIILPEKNLKKEALQNNGMYNLNAIIYQITNGKNGMPAFGGRLTEEEIENLSNYVLTKAKTNFKN
jgi:cytochrome c6